MIAEISAILGTLNAVNSAVSTIRTTSSNANSLGTALTRLGVASKAIDRVKLEKKAGKILSLNEATQLALAEKKLADYERELKDLCLISGNAPLYNRMKELQADSKKALELQQNSERRKKIQRDKVLEDVGIAVAIGVLILLLLGMFTFIYLGYTGKLK